MYWNRLNFEIIDLHVLWRNVAQSESCGVLTHVFCACYG